jgi:uncharacterized protein YggU (UPF0235/DUF167 family)
VSVHVQPRASCSEVVGLHGTALKVRLDAPPLEIDGTTEAAVRALAARHDETT